MDLGIPTWAVAPPPARCASETGASTPSSPLNGWGHNEAQTKVEQAGFDRHPVKPIERATLEAPSASIKPA
jgi:hypothetical protein